MDILRIGIVDAEAHLVEVSFAEIVTYQEDTEIGIEPKYDDECLSEEEPD
jgi:hypothetical protein